MSAIATVSSKFQISIPKEVREQMALRPGEKMAFIAKPEGFRIIPAPKREDLAGMARGARYRGLSRPKRSVLMRVVDTSVWISSG